MIDEWGIADGYFDVDGDWHDADPDVLVRLRDVLADDTHVGPSWFVVEGTRHALTAPCSLVLEDGTDLGVTHELTGREPAGYHSLRPVDGAPEVWLVVHPQRCPAAPTAWGVAVQVASLWRPDGWGIGDLRDVTELGQAIGARGASLLLLSPLHAPAPTVPTEDSPYYPSSRRWWSPLLLAPDAAASGGPTNDPAALVDRTAAWLARRRWTSERFHHERHEPRWRAWAQSQGHGLWLFAAWNTLADEFGPNWREWPEQFRSPDSPDVQDRVLHDDDFARRCEYHAYVQWLVATQLDDTATRAGVGLIGDLALGCRPDGADGWIDQDVLALDVSIGAPPDTFNPAGQSWGLPPYRPQRLRAARYQPFIQMLRATMRGMAGLRMDHVLGLFRQWWVPTGLPPTDGAYVSMPYEELLAILALESTRAGCFVVGEDLGTVGAEVTEALARFGVLGTTVWWFEPDAATWRTECLATITTHDLPTITGVVAGTDGTDEMRDALDELLDERDMTDPIDALHRELLASPARVRLITADDLAGQEPRPNYPGTMGDTHPNWRRRLPLTVTALADRLPATVP